MHHIGHSHIHTPNKTLNLKNVLHVPHASKNLLYVHHFSKDNDVFLEFHPDWFFFVKDRATRNLLLHDRCENGLYPIASTLKSRGLSLLLHHPGSNGIATWEFIVLYPSPSSSIRSEFMFYQ